MENKIHKLREAIKSNPNFSSAFKKNVMLLTDALVATLPEYDYRNFEKVLSTLILADDYQIPAYAEYDGDTNTLTFNTKKIMEYGIDIQHLFMTKVLSIATHKEEKDKSLRAFNDGMSETIASLFVPSTGARKTNVLEQLSVSTFTEIVDPKILLDAYMKDDISLITENLESYGIDASEFVYLLRHLTLMQRKDIPSNDGFAVAQKKMIYMYGKKVEAEISKGEMTKDDIKASFQDFDSSLVHTKEELCTLYNDDFRHVGGIKWIRTTLKIVRDRAYSFYEEMCKEQSPSK